ncbi:MAG: LysM peptidoglycan-binding domain-containing protein, partial [Alphaproteobacteria bacterium]
MTHISRVRLGTFPGTAALFRAWPGTDHSQFRGLGLIAMLALALCLFTALSLLTAKPAGAQQQQYQQQLSAVAADWNSVYPAHKTAKGLVNAEGIYVVLRGDTLYGIAKRFRVGERTLIQLNGLGEAGRIVTGQTLHVPLRSA